MKLTKEQIEDINDKCPYNQGIFLQPFGIPDSIKEHVIYTRYDIGSKPGSCWDDENTINEYYSIDAPADKFVVLDKVLEIVSPHISHSDYRKIESLIHSNEETEYGYYGDYTEERIEWIVLSGLYRALNID